MKQLKVESADINSNFVFVPGKAFIASNSFTRSDIAFSLLVSIIETTRNSGNKW